MGSGEVQTNPRRQCGAGHTGDSGASGEEGGEGPGAGAGLGTGADGAPTAAPLLRVRALGERGAAAGKETRHKRCPPEETHPEFFF